MIAMRSMLVVAVAMTVLAACSDNPVVRFPTAGSSPAVSAAPVTPVGQTGATSTYSYSCNEGIPLVVVVDDASGGATLTYSHDSSPFQQMTRVQSASGARYTNGTYDLQLEGNQAVLSYSGGAAFDSCARV